MSEADYLAQQASAAQAAIMGALADLKADLGRGADPRVWMKSHPWITLASVAMAGFAAATVVPTKEQQALRKLEAIERAIYGHRHHESTEKNGEHAESAHGAAPATGGFMGLVIRELISAVKPALISLVTSRMSPPPSEADSEPMDSARMDSAGQQA